MFGIEVNVVLVRRLWPRALLTPFTDAVDLTDADRRAYAMHTHRKKLDLSFSAREHETH